MTFPHPLTITSRGKASRILASPSQGGDIRHVVSILDPGIKSPYGVGRWHGGRILRLHYDDIERRSPSCPWYAPCSWDDVRRIVAFAADVDGPLLVHCHAGISRSTAAAWIILAHHFGPGREVDALAAMLAAQPRAYPNRRMLWMADRLRGSDALERAHRERWPDVAGEPEIPEDDTTNERSAR